MDTAEATSGSEAAVSVEPATTALAYSRSGTGPPLVLLHGIGSSRHAWNPVIPALAEHFDVVAVDLPGFGGSESLPAQVDPLPAALAASVGRLLDDLGLAAPHVAGNSLGGWVALELAGMRPVASVTLVSPAGLWPGRTPLYNLISLQASRWLAHHAAGPLSRVVNHPLGRLLVLGQTHGQALRIAPEYARAAIQAMGTCPGFDRTLNATARTCYRPGPRIGAPVTVAFGSRDLLLRRRSRHVEVLPPGTRRKTLPRCGHVPMADDPSALVALITESAARGQ